MFISDVQKKEECRNEALAILEKLGVTCKPKRARPHSGKAPKGKVFKVPLSQLPTQTVTLKTGQQIRIPKLVHEMCSFISTKPSIEGIFRKEGSKARQNELKNVLDGGRALGVDNQHVDVAALLKTFLRDLPEPLIPYTHHDLFLRCTFEDIGKKKTEALLLACLLLPLEHLNALTYILQFLHEIGDHNERNKMDYSNLAIVIGPSIFPIEEKLSPTTIQLRTGKICEIIQILIINAMEVGVLPEVLIENLGQTLSADLKKKKRRSGSLTRMFNGLKRIVGAKTVEDNHNVVTPDLLLTPINNNVVKKRRLQSNGLSNKKKKEVLRKVPDNALLSTPFTPHRTPVCMDLSGEQEKTSKDPKETVKEKKSQWFSRSKSLKNLKQEPTTTKEPRQTKTSLARRWSAINPNNNTKKTKKRNSFASTSAINKQPPTSVPEPDYIRISKVEYEDIKNRVTAMERRISMEIDNVQCQITSDNENNANEEVDVNNVKNVQTVYEQTLQSGQLSPTTDHLARRLSRELKIRRSCENKIIRSPSARKIGSMRRKSREGDGNNKLTRHQSWHVPPRNSIPRASLKRGKPNTVLTGLPAKSETPDARPKQMSCNMSGSSNDAWISAEGFFNTLKSTGDSSLNDRASLARLRSLNAGMVLAKAKLFDKLSDSESSGSLTKSIPRVKAGTKIGSNRHGDSRLSYRVRTLKYEDRKAGKKSMSPRRRNQFSHKQKMQIAKQYIDSSTEKSSNDKENLGDGAAKLNVNLIASPKTPRIPPHIKKPLNVRSPKRLCRTPVGIERGTPLRVLKTPLQSHI